MTPVPWDRQPSESADAYLEFRLWLDHTPRALPHRGDLATAYRWSERARAFDEARTAPTGEAALKRTWADACQVVAVEMRKLQRTVLETGDRKLDVRELRLLLDWTSGIREAVGVDEAGTLDVKRLTDAELEAVERVRKILAKA